MRLLQLRDINGLDPEWVERVERASLFVFLVIIVNVKIWIAFQYKIEIADGYVVLLNARRFFYGYDPFIFYSLSTPPLLPYMISLVWHLTGENIFVAEAIQPVFVVAGAWILCALLKRMFNLKVGLVASLFFLAMPEVFAATNLITAQSVGSFLLISTMYLLWRGVKGEQEFLPIAGGTLALATLVDYTNLVFAAALLLGMVVYQWDTIKAVIRTGSRGVRRSMWVPLAVIVFIAIWLPWIDWNRTNVGGNIFASWQAGQLSGQISTGTQGGFYITNLLSLLGIGGLLFLIVGLVDRNTLRVRRRTLLLMWIAAYLTCYSVIPNRQPIFYLEWSAPLAAFAALGSIRLEGKFPERSKILAWSLIALWIGYSYFIAINASLYASPISLSNQYSGVKNYDEFIQVVNWIDAHTNHTTIGATDTGPALSYFSNRLFYDLSWLSQQSNSSSIPITQIMQHLGVRIIVVQSTYFSRVTLYSDLILVQSFPDYAVFQLKI